MRRLGGDGEGCRQRGMKDEVDMVGAAFVYGLRMCCTYKAGFILTYWRDLGRAGDEIGTLHGVSSSFRMRQYRQPRRHDK